MPHKSVSINQWMNESINQLINQLFKWDTVMIISHENTEKTITTRQLQRKMACTTHTHTRLTALCPGLPGWAATRNVKPIWILRKQETVSGSGISWAICKSAPRSRQITTPAPYHPVFLQAGCPSCYPTNSVKALKAIKRHAQNNRKVTTYEEDNASLILTHITILQNFYSQTPTLINNILQI